MNAIKRFRDRQNRATVLDVPVPDENPTIVLKVHRFAQAEHNAAQKEAIEALSRRNTKELDESMKQRVFFAEYCEALAKFVKRHVKGWEYKGEDAERFDFSPVALDGLFSSMDSGELQIVGASYIVAVANEEKKAK